METHYRRKLGGFEEEAMAKGPVASNDGEWFLLYHEIHQVKNWHLQKLERGT